MQGKPKLGIGNTKMINSDDIEEMKWKGVRNLEPARVNELLRLANLGRALQDVIPELGNESEFEGKDPVEILGAILKKPHGAKNIF